MATILEFPASLTRANSSVSAVPGVPGQLVMFPGVRYEHVEEQGQSKAKKRTRRDHIEFED